VKSVCFSDDSKFIVSGDAEGNVMLWHRIRATAILAWHAHEGPVVSVEMHGNAVFTVGGGVDHTVKITHLS
jgi:WD40 repeat protein